MTSPTGPADVRRRNLSLVLRHIAAHGPCARTEVADATGLVHGSITALTAELIGSGLVHEVGLASSGARGRPRRLLELAPGRVLTIAIQVKKSQLLCAATDLGGAILWRDERPHHAEYGDPRPVVRAITEIVDDAWNAIRRSQARERGHLARVVVAVPGAVVEDEVVADSILLGWRRVDLRGLLRAQDPTVTCPISVVNEANMAAFAEYGALVDRTGEVPKVFAYLRVLRTGIGGGLVVDGAVQTGGHGMAGEFGHIPVSFDGPACKCGDHGCLVTYLGVPALLVAAGMDPDDYDPDLQDGHAEFDRRLRGGDPATIRALETGARALATALTAVSRVADPEKVVLGGHLAAWSGHLVPNVLRHLAGRRAVTPTDEPEISTDLLGEDATLLGALRYGCETVFDDPTSVPQVESVERPAVLP
ncbi:ROK family protein [Actinospica sp. MGRD01-02]|uniref:ROK family protein n=1 Tax=Actinospica acidithermotolerans TaxID=2828514 RepID=A0A941E9B1_9ACTN|nr:ROK family protein [Actinospica acidithermotolerans]MBR7827341.1 ROK family protein [Actinospica acidithermotolerans]